MQLRKLVACLAVAPLLGAAPALADTRVVCSDASPDALSAALSTANTSCDVTEQIADRLVEMEIGGAKLRQGLRESWTISPDGLRYNFKLRHGVKFQSNAAFKPSRDFNAEDVVFPYNRMLDHARASYKVGSGYDMFASFTEPALQSVTKEGDDTDAMTLRMPSASLLYAL